MSEKKTKFDPYQILGISQTAGKREMSAAYRKKALKLLPDRGGNIHEMKELNKARDILFDETKRAEYDDVTEAGASENIAGYLAGERPSDVFKQEYQKLLNRKEQVSRKEKFVAPSVTSSAHVSKTKFSYQPNKSVIYQTVEFKIDFIRSTKFSLQSVSQEVKDLMKMVADKIVKPNGLEKVGAVWFCDRVKEVTWVPDNESNKCNACKKRFWLFLRRHHCRLCGQIFCYACIDNYINKPDDNKVILICKICFINRHHLFVKRFLKDLDQILHSLKRTQSNQALQLRTDASKILIRIKALIAGNNTSISTSTNSIDFDVIAKELLLEETRICCFAFANMNAEQCVRDGIVGKLKNGQLINEENLAGCNLVSFQLVSELIQQNDFAYAAIICKVGKLNFDQFQAMVNYECFKYSYLSLFSNSSLMEYYCQKNQYFDAAYVARHLNDLPTNVTKDQLHRMISAIDASKCGGYNDLLVKFALRLSDQMTENGVSYIDIDFAYQILITTSPDHHRVHEINKFIAKKYQHFLDKYDFSSLVALLSVTKAGTAKVLLMNEKTENPGIKAGIYIIRAIVEQNKDMIWMALIAMLFNDHLENLTSACVHVLKLISNDVTNESYEKYDLDIKSKIQVKGIAKTILAFDNCIFGQKDMDLMEKVWVAIDTAVIGTGINSFLLPCYLLKDKKDVASESLVTVLMELALYAGYYRADPFAAAYAFRIFLAMNNGQSIDADRKQILTKMAKFIDNLQPVLPCFNIPLLSNLDFAIILPIMHRLCACWLRNLANENSECAKKARYLIFEGVWKGWMDGNFLEDRLACIKDVSNIAQIQDILNWPWIPREDGWISDAMLISEPSAVFGEMTSAVFDLSEGEMVVNFSPGNLLRVDDLCIIKNVIVSSFTLDMLDYENIHHPVQRMRYTPGCIAGSNYLATLFYADYLLKMIAAKCEISSNSPFEMRESQLLNRLPDKLRHLLDLQESSESIHRFWFESGEVKYTVSRNGSKIIIELENPKMVIKEMRQMLVDGKLVDDAFIDPTSPTAIFARNFTENYEEIGDYFPELLRLRQLAKIQAFGMIIREWQQMSVLIEKITADILDTCNTVKNIPALRAVETIVNEEIRKQGLHEQNISNLYEIRRNVKQQQDYIKSKFVEDLLADMRKAYSGLFEKIQYAPIMSTSVEYYNTAKRICHDFINGSISRQSAEHELLSNHENYFPSLSNLFKSINFTEDSQIDYENVGQSYVPAIFGGRNVYGGVHLASKPVNVTKLLTVKQSRFDEAVLHNPGIDKVALQNKLNERLTWNVQVFANRVAVDPVSKRMPTNYQFAGKTYPTSLLPGHVREKYPDSVPINYRGFADFAQYAISKQTINYSGDRRLDETAANAKAGYKTTPNGYTWHHHFDGKQMQLIPTDIHNAVRHTGGFAVFKARNN